MSCGKVQNLPGFVPCRVAKSKTRRVSRYVVWQSPKPAGFQAMSSGKVQNPPGFAPCRVAKSKTRRVSCYVEWQSPKPAGFRAMSCGKVQNPPNFSCTRVGAYCIRPEMSCDRGLRLKPSRFWAHPYWDRGNRVRFWRVRVGKYETGRIFHVPVQGRIAYAPKRSSPKVWV